MTRLSIALSALLLIALPSSATETQPLRLISLTPAISETLIEMDMAEQIVGRDQASDLRDVPIVADYQRVNLEAILRLKPTHVIAWQDSLPASLARQLNAFGITLLISNTRSLEDWINSTRQLEQALGPANPVAEKWQAGFDQLRTRFADSDPVATVWVIWPKPLMVVGGQGFQSELLALCGAKNPFGTVRQVAPTVDPEQLIRAQPALIVGSPEARTQIAEWPTLAGRAYWSPDNDHLSRPGPALLGATATLCEQIDNRRNNL